MEHQKKFFLSDRCVSNRLRMPACNPGAEHVPRAPHARAARVEHGNTRASGGLYRHAKRAFLERDDKEGARDHGRSSTALK